MGHLASKGRSFPSISQGSQVQRLQRKLQVKLGIGYRPALPRSEPIHFISAEGCTGVANFGMIDDNFDNVQWCDSIEINYNSANQSTYEQIDPVAAIHNVQKRQKIPAFTIVSMLPKDAEGEVIGLVVDAKCKTDTGTGANMQFLPLESCTQQCFIPVGNPLRESMQIGQLLRAYSGGIIKQFGVRIIKCIWYKQKWKLSFFIL